MKLRNLRFRQAIPYARAATLQESLVKQFLASKKAASSASSSPLPPPPPPTIITAQFHPVYTCGRREIGSVDARQQEHLRAGGRADFVEAMRGGQTTFHGPGQLVAYPVVDLRQIKSGGGGGGGSSVACESGSGGEEEGAVVGGGGGGCGITKEVGGAGAGAGAVRRGAGTAGLSPRLYVCTLEKGVIATLARFGITGFRTGDPGVWVSEEEKIASVGVHMRRNVTSHGVAVNVSTDLWWFDRIVACGLEGKRATSLEKLGVKASVEEVERVLVEELAKSFGCDGVEVEDVD